MIADIYLDAYFLLWIHSRNVLKLTLTVEIGIGIDKPKT